MRAIFLPRRRRRGGCRRRKARFAICGSTNGFSPVARDQLFTPEQWAKGDAPIDAALFTDGRLVYGGIDLSARVDLTRAGVGGRG